MTAYLIFEQLILALKQVMHAFYYKNERHWRFLQGYTQKLLARVLASMEGKQQMIFSTLHSY